MEKRKRGRVARVVIWFNVAAAALGASTALLQLVEVLAR